MQWPRSISGTSTFNDVGGNQALSGSGLVRVIRTMVPRLGLPWMTLFYGIIVSSMLKAKAEEDDSIVYLCKWVATPCPAQTLAWSHSSLSHMGRVLMYWYLWRSVKPETHGNSAYQNHISTHPIPGLYNCQRPQPNNWCNPSAWVI